jgi:hypothetical protein
LALFRVGDGLDESNVLEPLATQISVCVGHSRGQAWNGHETGESALNALGDRGAGKEGKRADFKDFVVEPSIGVVDGTQRGNGLEVGQELPGMAGIDSEALDPGKGVQGQFLDIRGPDLAVQTIKPPWEPTTQQVELHRGPHDGTGQG